VAHAPTLEAVHEVAATGAEFVAVSDAVWATPGAEAAAVREAIAALARSGAPA
jgi:thiamine monophosphate synthase